MEICELAVDDPIRGATALEFAKVSDLCLRAALAPPASATACRLVNP